MSSQDPPAAALAEIARQATEAQDEATTFLRQLVACETAVRSPVTPEFLAETRKCRSLVAGMLEGLGCEVHEWDTQDGYPTLAARLPGSGVGRSLTFNGHIDVVPVGDTSAWSHDPWAGEIVDGKLYGRGTADMKAGLVSMIYAAKSVLAAGYRPAGDVWFHVVSDEELVGYGTRDCIEKFPANCRRPRCRTDRLNGHPNGGRSWNTCVSRSRVARPTPAAAGATWLQAKTAPASMPWKKG